MKKFLPLCVSMMLFCMPFFLWSDNSFAASFESVNAIQVNKNQNGSYNINIHLKNGKTISAMQDLSPDEINSRIGFNNFGNNLVGITVSCGSPCYNTTFYNLETGEVSPTSFFLTIALDSQHDLVAYPNDAEGELIIANIFNPTQKMIIKRDFSPIATLAISSELTFLQDKPAIKFDYPAGPDYRNVSEIIPLDYKKLGVGQ